MLLPCSYLPVETPLKSSKSHRTVSRRANSQQASPKETTGTADEDILRFTPNKLQELYESIRNQCEDHCGIVPLSHVVEEDIDPCQVDSRDSEQPVGTVDDWYR